MPAIKTHTHTRPRSLSKTKTVTINGFVSTRLFFIAGFALLKSLVQIIGCVLRAFERVGCEAEDYCRRAVPLGMR
eukprot:4421032-Amphidinium_carterae.1